MCVFSLSSSSTIAFLQNYYTPLILLKKTSLREKRIIFFLVSRSVPLEQWQPYGRESTSRNRVYGARILRIYEFTKQILIGSYEFTIIEVVFFCFSLQDDHRGFRRQLEDKRPVVENNLLSGRQYIANEPPLSDTSDSEGTLHDDLHYKDDRFI